MTRSPDCSPSPPRGGRALHDQVPRVQAPPRPRSSPSWLGGPKARSALDLFTGTTRVGQAFKLEGAEVTAVDSTRCAAVLAGCYVATDGDAVDPDVARAGRGRAQCPAGPSRVCHRDVLRAFPVLPAGQRGADRRRARRHRRALRGHVAGARAAHEPSRGRGPCGLHDRRADGIREALGRPFVPAARAPGATSPCRARIGPCGAMPVRWRRVSAQFDLAYLDPPYNQHRYEANYHIWETLVAWDVARPLRGGVQADRGARRGAQRVQLPPHHARGLGTGRARRPRPGSSCCRTTTSRGWASTNWSRCVASGATSRCSLLPPTATWGPGSASTTPPGSGSGRSVDSGTSSTSGGRGARRGPPRGRALARLAGGGPSQLTSSVRSRPDRFLTPPTSPVNVGCLPAHDRAPDRDLPGRWFAGPVVRRPVVRRAGGLPEGRSRGRLRASCPGT